LYSLEDIGWDAHFQQQLEQLNTPGIVPARVAEELRGAYRLHTTFGLVPAVVPGRLLHRATAREDLPAVGDWVLAGTLPGEERMLVLDLFNRRTKLSRQQAGEKFGEQILAANVDTVFLVASLNKELNLRRIERFLTAVWESGARPVIALNKADLSEERAALRSDVEDVTPGVPVVVTSAVTGDGVGELAAHLAPGETAVFIGSSGVGKSSLINRITGEDSQFVSHIRAADDRGRHTTTTRQMLVLPGRGVIIDTPGLRELQLWDSSESGGSAVFSEIAELAATCAFSDCRHETEPGCAVRAAIEDDRLDQGRFSSYRKLEREQMYVARKHDKSLQIEETRRWKQIHKENRRRMKLRGR
jgi:ribosome biogenesis GTPase